MSTFGKTGPLERSIAGATEVVNSLKKQVLTFHPNSNRRKFAQCFLNAREKSKLQLEQQYIKLTGRDSPPLPSKEAVEADVLPNVN